MGCLCGCHHPDDVVKSTPPAQPQYTFYAVADRTDLAQTRWYRTYSRGSSSGWVNDINDAKVWIRKGGAQGKCTSLGGNAQLVEFVVTKVNVFDQKERLQKLEEKRKEEAARAQKAQAARELKAAETALRLAQEKLARLKGKQPHPADCGCKSCMGM